MLLHDVVLLGSVYGNKIENEFNCMMINNNEPLPNMDVCPELPIEILNDIIKEMIVSSFKPLMKLIVPPMKNQTAYVDISGDGIKLFRKIIRWIDNLCYVNRAFASIVHRVLERACIYVNPCLETLPRQNFFHIASSTVLLSSKKRCQPTSLEMIEYGIKINKKHTFHCNDIPYLLHYSKEEHHINLMMYESEDGSLRLTLDGQLASTDHDDMNVFVTMDGQRLTLSQKLHWIDFQMDKLFIELQPFTLYNSVLEWFNVTVDELWNDFKKWHIEFGDPNLTPLEEFPNWRTARSKSLKLYRDIQNKSKYLTHRKKCYATPSNLVREAYDMAEAYNDPVILSIAVAGNLHEMENIHASFMKSHRELSALFSKKLFKQRGEQIQAGKRRKKRVGRI